MLPVIINATSVMQLLSLKINNATKKLKYW